MLDCLHSVQFSSYEKPKVEVAVQVVERWILARLRHKRFFSLGALNRAIAALQQDLNQRAIDAAIPAQASLPLHENVRGPDYYH